MALVAAVVALTCSVAPLRIGLSDFRAPPNSEAGLAPVPDGGFAVVSGVW